MNGVTSTKAVKQGFTAHLRQQLSRQEMTFLQTFRVVSVGDSLERLPIAEQFYFTAIWQKITAQAAAFGLQNKALSNAVFAALEQFNALGNATDP